MNSVSVTKKIAPFAVQIADRLAIRDMAQKLAEKNRERGDADLATEWESLAALSEREMAMLAEVEAMHRIASARN